jgi:hypothetical protein
MLINIGKRWVIDYTPSLYYYSNDSFNDHLDHRATLTGGADYENWTFGLFQSFSLSSSPNDETLSQSETESFATSLSANYAFNSQLSLDMSVAQDIRSTSDFQSYWQWSNSDYLNYRIHPRFIVGLGPTFSYTDVDGGSDMTSESLQARVQLSPGTKIGFSLNGGVEFRQFLDNDAETMVSPVFGASLSYALFDRTSVALSANHSVSPSYFSNQVSERSSLGVSVSQGLFKHFDLALRGGYSTGSYVAATPGLSETQSDDRWNFSARLSTRVLKRGSIGVSYTYTFRDSDQPGFSFDSNMVGVDLSYRW